MTLADLLIRAAMLSVTPDTTDLAPLRARVFGRLRASGWAPAGDERGRAATLAESDERLLAALTRGDASAFDALFDRHAAQLNGHARRWLQPADAADVVQEVFLVLFEKAPDVLAHEQVNVGGFLFGTLRKKVSHVLAVKEKQGPEQAPEEPSPEDGLTALLRREDAGRLARLLERTCNPLEQDVVMLGLEDCDGPEIARRLGLTPGNARVVRHRALGKLRRALEEEEGS